MSMSAATETQLIGRAQAGDEFAKLRLIDAYGPYIEATVHDLTSTPDDADDLRQELKIAALLAIRDYEPAGEPGRLWGLLEGKARDATHATLTRDYAASVPTRTARRAKLVDELINRGEALPVALHRAHIMQATYEAVRAAFGWAEVADFDRPAAAYDDSRTVELSEAALDGMTDKQSELCQITYGFTAPLPSDANGNGLSDAEVASRYNTPARVADDRGVARRTVTDNIAGGLLNGKVAIAAYLASDGE